MKLSTVLRHPFAKHCWVARLGQWRWPGRGGQWTQGGQRVDTVKGRGGRKVLQVWWHTPSMTHMLKNRQFMCNYRYKNYKYCCWKGVSTVQGGRLGSITIRVVVPAPPGFVRTLPILPRTLTALQLGGTLPCLIKLPLLGWETDR